MYCRVSIYLLSVAAIGLFVQVFSYAAMEMRIFYILILSCMFVLPAELKRTIGTAAALASILMICFAFDFFSSLLIEKREFFDSAIMLYPSLFLLQLVIFFGDYIWVQFFK